MADMNFDARGVDPTRPTSPVPHGKYRAHITASEVKPTKKADGKYLQLEWTILEGEFKGRKFWSRLNIQNKNQTAVDIAQRDLSAICHATGVLTLKNSQQLHHIPCIVKVTVKKDEGQDETNEVKGYEACEGGPGIKPPKSGNTAFGAAGAAAVSSSTNTPAPAPSGEAPPWARSKAS